MMTSKVGWFAAGFRILMQGCYRRHLASVFRRLGVIPHENQPMAHTTGPIFSDQPLPPERHEALDLPGGGMEKVQPRGIMLRGQGQRANDRTDAEGIVSKNEPDNDHHEPTLGGPPCKRRPQKHQKPAELFPQVRLPS